LFIANEQAFLMNKQKRSGFSCKFARLCRLACQELRAVPRDNHQPPKIPALSRQLAELVEAQGLHGLFVGFRTIHPTIVLFCHTFCSTPFSRGQGVAKKTFALQPPPPCCTCARKKQLQAIIHNM